jgi:subtilisin family serine protease
MRIRYLLAAIATLLPLAAAAQSQSRQIPDRLVIVYRNGIPVHIDEALSNLGLRAHSHLRHLGITTLQADPRTEDLVIARLRSLPQVASVLHDLYVTGHAMLIRPIQAIQSPVSTSQSSATTSVSTVLQPIGLPVVHGGPISGNPSTDIFYDSPQNWAVLQSGGFGDNTPGGPSTGPWNITRGAGVRIAILDSGIDANHPDLAPNLVFNLSEIDQTALPSPCDDGSPQDQQGHGTFAASLAAAAIGGGNTIGVAPQASLLNIKVLQRMPATTGANLTAQCEAGEPSGLLSWVLQGIDDAVAQRADVISLSLGTLVDISTGEGAGWQAAFNQATYAAAQSGAVIVAALGNDSLNLSSGTLVELPAQSRSVLSVVAATNPACAEDLTPNASCVAGPVTRAFYSNYGVAGILAAPGGSVPEGPDTGVSGYIRGACSNGLTNTVDGLPISGGGQSNQSFGCFGLGHTQYVQTIGTSASAPLVAGAAAILRASHPGWSAAQIIAVLLSSATTSTTMAEPQLNLPAALGISNP